eukprot:4715-Chlamydomonas_euryale.AAC.3
MCHAGGRLADQTCETKVLKCMHPQKGSKQCNVLCRAGACIAGHACNTGASLQAPPPLLHAPHAHSAQTTPCCPRFERSISGDTSAASRRRTRPPSRRPSRPLPVFTPAAAPRRTARGDGGFGVRRAAARRGGLGAGGPTGLARGRGRRGAEDGGAGAWRSWPEAAERTAPRIAARAGRVWRRRRRRPPACALWGRRELQPRNRSLSCDACLLSVAGTGTRSSICDRLCSFAHSFGCA